MATKQSISKKKLPIIILVLLVLIAGVFFYVYLNRPKNLPIQVAPQKINTVIVKLKPGGNIETVLSDFGLPQETLTDRDPSPAGLYYLKVPENELAGEFAIKISTNSAVEKASVFVPTQPN